MVFYATFILLNVASNTIALNPCTYCFKLRVFIDTYGVLIMLDTCNTYSILLFLFPYNSIVQIQLILFYINNIITWGSVLLMEETRVPG